MTAQEKIAHRLTLQQCGKSNIERGIIKGGAEALHARVATPCARFPGQRVGMRAASIRSTSQLMNNSG